MSILAKQTSATRKTQFFRVKPLKHTTAREYRTIIRPSIDHRQQKAHASSEHE